jgi:signal transduction histidine kinase
VKFTPEGGSITVTACIAGGPDDCWGEVRITDTGPGILPAERAAIFEPYVRGEGAATVPGVGLGLAISQRLMVQMGGTIAVESEPGAGATFVVRLRCLPPAEAGAQPAR